MMGRHEYDGLDDETPDRPNRSWLLPFLVVTVIAVLLAAGMMAIHDVRTQLRKSEENQQVLSDQVERLGGVPLVSPSAGPQGERGEPGRAPTAAEISAAVSAYLSAHPPAAGRAPTSREIASAVAAYIRANPPQSGRSPTTDEIAAAVAAYLRAHPPARGPAGEKGEPGETVTGPPGPKGEPGKDSTVPGPQGERGPEGPPPSSFEFTFAGIRYVCRPTGTGSANYECSPEPAAP